MSILFGLDEVQDEASQDIVAAVRAGILLCFENFQFSLSPAHLLTLLL